MTAIASAVVTQAAIVSAPPALGHPTAGRGGAHGFCVALDALSAGEGKARSTEDDGKHATDDQADPASAQPSSDLRAALIGGALASLAVAPGAASVVGATPADDSGSGAAAKDGARKMASAADVPSAGAETGAPQAGRGAALPAMSAVGARLTAERSYLAPAVSFMPAAHAAAEASGVAASTPDASAAASRPAFAPGDARTVPDGRSATISPQRTSAGSRANPQDAPAAAASRADPSGVTVSTDAPASRAAPAANGRLPAATASGAPHRVAPPSARQSGSTPAATSGSASAAATTSGAAKAHVESELDRDLAEGRETRAPVASAAATVQAGAASFGAAAGQAAFSLTDSATKPGEALPPTRAAAAPPPPLADKVHEIDLDLAPTGLKDATMTVRLAGDKLGVVVRAASGETAATIEGARDAIAERLAAIGQPVASLIIQQTGASDAKGAAGQSAGEGDGGAPQDQSGEAGDPRGSRRGSARF